MYFIFSCNAALSKNKIEGTFILLQFKLQLDKKWQFLRNGCAWILCLGLFGHKTGQRMLERYNTLKK